MKVYMIIQEPFPNGMAATNRIKSYVKAFQYAGVESRILILSRTEYVDNVKNVDISGSYDGIPFQYMGDTTIRSRNLIVRKWNDFRDKNRLKQYLKENLVSGDIVFAYCGREIGFIDDLIKITHRCNAKFVRDLCELPFGTGKESLKAVVMRRYTLNIQFPKIDGFIPISESLKTLTAKYITAGNGKQLKVPIMVDFKKFDMDDASDMSEIPYIFHSGTLYEQKDGILGMIEGFGLACQQIAHPIQFILTGSVENSPHAKEISLLIEKYKLQDKVLFTGYLSNEDLKQYLAKASLVIINKYRTQQNEYCFSTKLGEYLAATKPLIITNVGEAVNWLKNQESAYIIDPEDTNELARAIKNAFDDPEMRKCIAKNGKELCKKSFDYRVWGKAMVEFFESLY